MTEILTSGITSLDVLCGRGGATNNHVGNKRFRAMVAEHQPQYLNAKKRDKANIARRIVQILRGRGSRFLKKAEGKGPERWVDVGDKKATEKTSQALREGLDVRHADKAVGDKATAGTKTGRADPETGKSTGTPAQKRRRTTGPTAGGTATANPAGGSKNAPHGSPALVSEGGECGALPLSTAELEGDAIAKAQYVFDPPPVVSSDCSNVEAV
uniref:DUF6824 domain-containing protein n=1 Tax=Helicotheca tamesis TaxID=374047 RepID=A0A6U0HIK5_9STRA|mmetsp:Transcript_7869/g.10799  ORF Transcript_7869/g.10799 Transcript_7869/m.10799 type:complete len:213 (+) Transcript_7869:82-720(+)